MELEVYVINNMEVGCYPWKGSYLLLTTTAIEFNAFFTFLCSFIVANLNKILVLQI